MLPFNEHDTLKITGPACGYYWNEYRLAVRDFLCIAATVYREANEFVAAEDVFTFKVWPCDVADPQLPAGHDSKIWFDARTCQIEVIERAEW